MTPSVSLFLEGTFVIELHQRLHARAEGRPTAGHRRRLDRLEKLALRRAVLDRAAHVRHDAVLKGAIGEDADDHHLAVLDRELLALADRELAQRSSRAHVLRIFLGHPVPERIAIWTRGLPIDLVAHRSLLSILDVARIPAPGRRYHIDRGGIRAYPVSDGVCPAFHDAGALRRCPILDRP